MQFHDHERNLTAPLLLCRDAPSLAFFALHYSEHAPLGQKETPTFRICSKATNATMINPDWRFWSPPGGISPGGPSQWYIFDTDQRRMIVVTTDDEQDEEDLAVRHLKRHIHDLGPEV